MQHPLLLLSVTRDPPGEPRRTRSAILWGLMAGQLHPVTWALPYEAGPSRKPRGGCHWHPATRTDALVPGLHTPLRESRPQAGRAPPAHGGTRRSPMGCVLVLPGLSFSFSFTEQVCCTDQIMRSHQDETVW